jgi:hypothetical protein
MANYYFLAALLPPLALGKSPELSLNDLISLIAINMQGEDLEKTVVFRRWIDLNNIRALYLENPIDGRGNLSEKELDQALLLEDGFPEYVFDFLNRFEDVQQKIRFFPGLLAAYFREEELGQEGFLKNYLEFEKSWRLVLMAIKAKELGRDYAEELQFEDLKDSLVLDILAQKDASSYEPPVEFISLRDAYLACGKDPWEQFKAILEWRFNQIEELVEKPLFSIDWILAYMARLLIVEEMNDLKSRESELILEAFVG